MKMNELHKLDKLDKLEMNELDTLANIRIIFLYCFLVSLFFNENINFLFCQLRLWGGKKYELP